MDLLTPIDHQSDIVDFELSIGGTVLPGSVSVLSIEVEQEVNRIPAARLVILDGDPALGDWPISNEDYFVPGSEIEIRAGYSGQVEPIFSGLVVEQRLRVRHRRIELEVACRGISVTMTTAVRSRAFAETTDSDALTTLTSDYELTPDFADTEVVHQDLLQYHCSDWDFLLQRLESTGMVAYEDQGTLFGVRPALADSAAGILRFGTNIIEMDLSLDGRTQKGTISAEGWNATDQSRLLLPAAAPEWTTPGDTDPAALASAMGAEEDTLRFAGELTEEELQAWADARQLRSRMALVRGRIQTQGIPGIRPTDTYTLEGCGNRFNGDHWVSGYRHQIANGNWVTDIQLGLNPATLAQAFDRGAPNLAGLVPDMGGLHLAKVIQLSDDPDSAFRVRVQLPAIDGEENGVWARLARSDAGEERGAFLYPEIGDEVVVGFFQDDPRQAIILGSLHSPGLPGVEAGDDDNYRKGWTSKSGVVFSVDDEKSIATVETPGGNQFRLDDDEGGVFISDQNGNTLTLNGDGIEINSASDLILKAGGDLSAQGLNVALAADAELKAEGSAGAEFSSSGQAVVKGAVVMIN